MPGVLWWLMLLKLWVCPDDLLSTAHKWEISRWCSLTGLPPNAVRKLKLSRLFWDQTQSFIQLLLKVNWHPWISELFSASHFSWSHIARVCVQIHVPVLTLTLLKSPVELQGLRWNWGPAFTCFKIKTRVESEGEHSTRNKIRIARLMFTHLVSWMWA